MPTGIRYQERDKLLLAELGELGLLDTDTIRQRHFPQDNSGRACPKKLAQYESVGLVQSAAIQLQNKDTKVWMLTPHGAGEVARLTGHEPSRPGRADPPKPSKLLHRLGMVRTRLALDDAFVAARLSAPTWLMEQDTYPGANVGDPAPRRFLLYESFGQGSTLVKCNPDASCCAHLPGGWQLVAYFEYDRSTETNARVAEKLPGYATLLAQRRYREHWPQVGDRHIVRILFICQSPERITNLRKAFDQVPIQRYLRFAVERDLAEGGELLTRLIWYDHEGERRAILKAPPSSS